MVRDQDWFWQDGASSQAKSVPQENGRYYSWEQVHIHPKQILHMLVDCFKDKINPLWIELRTSLQMQTLNNCCWTMGWGNFFKLKKYNHFYIWSWLKSNWNRFQPKCNTLKEHSHGKVVHGKASRCSKNTVPRPTETPYPPITGDKCTLV